MTRLNCVEEVIFLYVCSARWRAFLFLFLVVIFCVFRKISRPWQDIVLAGQLWKESSGLSTGFRSPFLFEVWGSHVSPRPRPHLHPVDASFVLWGEKPRLRHSVWSSDGTGIRQPCSSRGSSLTAFPSGRTVPSPFHSLSPVLLNFTCSLRRQQQLFRKCFCVYFVHLGAFLPLFLYALVLNVFHYAVLFLLKVEY
jgi:hypothetical protein